MRRRAFVLGLLALLATGVTLTRPGPVAAESSSKTITTTVAIGGVREVGGSWVSNADCGAGTISGFEYSCAFEFDISSIANSKVTAATLSVRRTTGCATNDCKVDLAVYTGDGSAGLGDMAQGSGLASWTPTSSTKQFDVTDQVDSRAGNANGWIGFRISTGTGATNTTPQAFDMAGANRVSLAVTYVFNPVNVQVYLSGVGEGAFGSVVSSPAGIDCGTSCLWWFSYAEPITLTAVPASTATFGYWQGGPCDQSHDPVCQFLVPALNVETNALFYGKNDNSTQPPPPTPTARPSTPAATAHASKAPGATEAPVATDVPPTDVVASDGTVITPAPTEVAAATVAPTIVGIDDGDEASSSGGIGLPIVILLILILGGVVGGGVYWFTKHRQAAP